MANLQGQFVSTQNLIAAAAMIVAIPTLIVYVLLQKQFIAGLALGSSKRLRSRPALRGARQAA